MKEYHLTGEPNDADSWLTKAELDQQGYVIGRDTDAERTVGESGTSSTPTSQGQGQATSASGAGPEPEFWKYWSGGEAWPPKEQVKTGNKDKFGNDIYEQRPNFALIRQYRTWERGEFEKAEKAEKEQVKEEESAANIATDNQRAQQALDLQQEEFAYRQQQDALDSQPKRPSSLIGLMAEALDSGNIERARGLWEFENQITPLQYLQLTLEYADNPEALKVLFDFVQARRPGIIGGQGQGPVSGQPSPSQQAGFAPGSYTARSFDASDPATQQQYLLRQQYIKAGGVVPSFQPGEAMTSLQARYPGAPAESLQEESLRLTGQGQVAQPVSAFKPLSAQPGGEVDLPNVPQAQAQGFRLSGDTDQDREGFTAQNPAFFQPVDNSTWEGFMSDFKPFPDAPGTIADTAKNLAAGNPYAGKTMATDPVTGQWSNWVDQQSGQVFMEIPGGGLSATERFEPVTKPATTPSPFNPVDLEGYLRATQTLSASKKPKQRSPFGAPVFVPRR